MNRQLFTKSGLYQVIIPVNAPAQDEFDYGAHYREFFEYMNDQGSSDYGNPDWLRKAIHEQSKKFIADFCIVFGHNPDNIKGALEKNKCFKTPDAYFDALRMKFAGNLLEAIMDAYFSHANIIDNRLQPFTKFESSFGGEDDASGVDGWLVSADGVRIPVNAKHLAFDGVTKDAAFSKLKASKLDFVKTYAVLQPDAVLNALKTPDGVIFTDAAVGRNEHGRKFKREKFPDVIVIDETGLFAATGHHANGVPNIAFWHAAMNDFAKCFCN